MEVDRLNYSKGDASESESDVSYMVKQTVTQGCNDGGLISFRFPADPERYLLLSFAYLLELIT
jgi:hypothetical protein